jgi:hypothetical protein
MVGGVYKVTSIGTRLEVYLLSVVYITITIDPRRVVYVDAYLGKYTDVFIASVIGTMKGVYKVSNIGMTRESVQPLQEA